MIHETRPFVVALSGGHLAFAMGINAFIADISSPEQRSFRMAMMYFVSSLGRPIGTQMGAYLYEQENSGRLIINTFLKEIWRFRINRNPKIRLENKLQPRLFFKFCKGVGGK